MKNADYIKTEKAKKEAEKLESQMMVALQTIETTSNEIIKLRESELYPQLFKIVKGLVFSLISMNTNLLNYYCFYNNGRIGSKKKKVKNRERHER